jgi:hypothetical protein
MDTFTTLELRARRAAEQREAEMEQEIRQCRDAAVRRGDQAEVTAAVEALLAIMQRRRDREIEKARRAEQWLRR